MAAPRICLVEGCHKPVKARGWCGTHYVRWQRHGDPSGGRTAWGEPLTWLHKHANHTDADTCLTWPFAYEQNGYAVLRIGVKNQRAHREMCRIVYGEPPTSLHEAAHTCGKGHEGCVNPYHLRWDTRSGNFADKLIHGTHNRGDQCPVAKLSEAEVRLIKRLIGSQPISAIARRFGVSPGAIYSIRSGASWSWLD